MESNFLYKIYKIYEAKFCSRNKIIKIKNFEKNYDAITTHEMTIMEHNWQQREIWDWKPLQSFWILFSAFAAVVLNWGLIDAR